MKKTMIAAALVSAALLSGCASAPDSYYTLAAASEPMAAPFGAPADAPAGAPIFIELAPVAMAERLARPQMVISKAGSAEVGLLEQHRWASSFDNELRDALASGIAARLGAIDVTRGARQASTPAWRIAVQLRQFDAVENAQIDAALSWTVRRSDGAFSAACQWSGREQLGGGIPALALGAQRLTGRASEAIAHHVAALNVADAAVGEAVGGVAAACRP
jgi:uncharacterized lipoprotein YmbA